MRVFLSTGEASGEMIAVALAQAMRELRPDITFTGIGAERMRAAGVELTASTRGWASMGPIDALGKIPKLLVVGLRQAFALRRRPVDLVVLVDFGAFNIRVARSLRTLGYRGAILSFFPPGAWFDDPKVARVVARTARVLTAFEHQRDFYRSLGLEIGYVGHPLVSLVAPRERRAVAAGDGGVVALLPGSRVGEVRRHLPRLLAACALLRTGRPNLEIVISVADQTVSGLVTEMLAREAAQPVRLVSGAREALDAADVALVASGTAVLEAALREVPTVALCVVSEAQANIARRIYHRPYVTLPNLLLDRALVPELLQDDATPEKLAAAAEALLGDPSAQLAGMREVRAALGPPDALERCARFALEVAGA
jgi:lipid-A-disaccharide synthase